jgi:tetratricopeptide (TPR) repeat protein
MKRKLMIVLGVVALALLATGCQKLKARDQLNKGVQAFRNAQYALAVEHFKTAIELDPTFDTARLYLATAYMNQYIPGAESPENQQMAQAAFDEFNRVLQESPNDTVALASIAMLKLMQKEWDESKEWYEKLIAVDPTNKEAYYSLGFIAWSKWYPIYGTARAGLGMKPEDPGPIRDKKVKEELKAKYLPGVEEGIRNLEKALQLDPEYDDAMAYINLLTREKADLLDDVNDYKKQIEIADDWIQKALAAKRAKAERIPGGGVH